MQKALRHLKASDPVMRRLIEELGAYGIEFLPPNFETLAKAIVLQQLSGKVASTIFRRLVAACGDGCLAPDAVLRLAPAEMRALGLSGRKVEYIRNLAELTVSGALDFERLRRFTDQQVMRRLTEIKGIGVWTVQMFLMFALKRVDVMPSGDLGIRAAVRKAYGYPELPKPAEIDRLAGRWEPYRTVASWYLWRSLENQPGL